ncbi:MAG: tetratricopeptide repeat protein [Polyangiaceae bacterium]|nr:tetratricopeptide repeat protein [Polyangiaceae bacterium]
MIRGSGASPRAGWLDLRRALAPRFIAIGAALAALALSDPAAAISASEARTRAESAIAGVEGGVGNVQKAAARATKQKMTPAQRIAAGDILFRNKDYERSIEVFSQVVELGRQGRADSAAHADGLFYLGESYFKSKQYLSARRAYREILEKSSASPYDSYAGRAVSRLVDVSLRTQNYDVLDEVFAKLSSLPTSDSSGSLQYARGKALFAKKDYDAAKASIGNVPTTGAWGLQGQYLLGVILVKQATPAVDPATEKADKETASIVTKGATEAVPTTRYAAAIEQFRRVTRMKAETDAQKQVIDLAWMAIGRLFYETDNFLDAADAYSHVDRKSPEFSGMLYELAWVYVRLGDYQRAQRSLEVLAVTDPDNLRFADGSLLRADLMLRSGQFEKALTLYKSVRSRFDPIREQVTTFLADTQDPAIYYDKLVGEQLGSEKGGLSPVVIQWAREEAENERAFGMIDDVTASRDLIKKSRRLVSKLNAVLGSGTRMRAFPELIAAMEQALGLLNKSGQARRTLAQGMDDEAGSASGELEKVRSERRALMKRMDQLPVNPGDFSQREASGEKQWNKVSQRLQQLELESDKLQAIVNGLKRVLKDADKFGVTSDPTSRQRFQAEITANEKDLGAYKKRIAEYREMVDMGRVQIGFGDQRYVEDDQVRRRFREVFNREVELVAGGADPGAADYARQIQPILRRANTVEDALEQTKGRLEREADAQAQSLREQVEKEAAALDKFAQNLDELDEQARLLVGELAMKNFGLVRDRLKSIVLRADVGIVQHAWEVREEQLMRVRNLQRERAREEQNLNDELREVLDDAGGEL